MIAAQMMTPCPVLRDSAPLSEVIGAVRGSPAAVVVDPGGGLAGVVTPATLARCLDNKGGLEDPWCMEAWEGEGWVDRFVHRSPPTVSPEAGLEEVMAALDGPSGGAAAVVVTDDGGRPLGVVTPGDVAGRLWKYQELAERRKG